eukprot:TRINITY_DN7433_c0_g1_i6.p1 TRINITY_DN7433_c0_g1~~TRINITY_DN7433_c0_g1_i6.p1  ORF type:complete len:657 (+),score=126.17 TRINITY_DN7433_c0_g1_i6:45-2015(+)
MMREAASFRSKTNCDEETGVDALEGCSEDLKKVFNRLSQMEARQIVLHRHLEAEVRQKLKELQEADDSIRIFSQEVENKVCKCELTLGEHRCRHQSLHADIQDLARRLIAQEDLMWAGDKANQHLSLSARTMMIEVKAQDLDGKIQDMFVRQQTAMENAATKDLLEDWETRVQELHSLFGEQKDLMKAINARVFAIEQRSWEGGDCGNFSEMVQNIHKVVDAMEFHGLACAKQSVSDRISHSEAGLSHTTENVKKLRKEMEDKQQSALLSEEFNRCLEELQRENSQARELQETQLMELAEKFEGLEVAQTKLRSEVLRAGGMTSPPESDEEPMHKLSSLDLVLCPHGKPRSNSKSGSQRNSLTSADAPPRSNSKSGSQRNSLTSADAPPRSNSKSGSQRNSSTSADAPPRSNRSLTSKLASPSSDRLVRANRRLHHSRTTLVRSEGEDLRIGIAEVHQELKSLKHWKDSVQTEVEKVARLGRILDDKVESFDTMERRTEQLFIQVQDLGSALETLSNTNAGQPRPGEALHARAMNTTPHLSCSSSADESDGTLMLQGTGTGFRSLQASPAFEGTGWAKSPPRRPQSAGCARDRHSVDLQRVQQLLEVQVKQVPQETGPVFPSAPAGAALSACSVLRSTSKPRTAGPGRRRPGSART